MSPSDQSLQFISSETSASAGEFTAMTTAAAAQISSLDGDQISIFAGETTFIDKDSNAVVTDDGSLSLLTVYFTTASATEFLGIDTSGAVRLSNGLLPGSKVFIVEDGHEIEIGELLEGSDQHILDILFNTSATGSRVTQLIRALTYKNATADTALSLKREIFISLTDSEGEISEVEVNAYTLPVPRQPLTSGVDNLFGSDARDAFTAHSGTITAGDQIEGKGGIDLLELKGGGIFQLNLMQKLSGIEIIEGSTEDDIVHLRAEQLSGINVIDGKGSSSDDILRIEGASINLTGKTILSFKEIALQTQGATITLDDESAAKLVTGYETRTDKLILTKGLLDDEERLALHRQGIDTIVDESGRMTIHYEPQVDGLHGDHIEFPESEEAVHLDDGRNAVIRSDDGLLRSLIVQITKGQNDYDRLGIDTTGSIRLVGGLGAGGRILFEDIEIGSIASSDATSLRIAFNDKATPERVQSLIHALTYSNTNPSPSSREGREIRIKLTDIGGRSSEDVVEIGHVNHDPDGLTFADGSMAASVPWRAPGAVIGVLKGHDPDLGDSANLTYAIAPGGDPYDLFMVVGSVSEGYRLKLRGDLTALHAGSYEVKIRMTDDRGGIKDTVLKVHVPNHAPTDISLSGLGIRELSSTGTVIGALSVQDIDSTMGDTFTFSLLDDAGGRFKLVTDGNTTSIAVADGYKLDYEQARSHTITVRVSDAGNDGIAGNSDDSFLQKTFVINVGDWESERTSGSDASDLFIGGVGNDTLHAGDGDDKIKGENGNDNLNGEAGHDTIFGGLGKDTLAGGSGMDKFVFSTSPKSRSNVDHVLDFNVRDDSLWLDNAIFKKIGRGSEANPGKLNSKFFVVGSKAKDSNDYVVYNSKNGHLYYDKDGVGKGGAVLIAKLGPKLKMKASDFFVI